MNSERVCAGRDNAQAGRRRALRRLLLAVCCLILIPGCGYPSFSKEAFEIAKAIDNLCNLKQTEKLPMARAIVAEKAKSGAITSKEEQWLTAILDTAERGDWDAASAEARQILVDQQRR